MEHWIDPSWWTHRAISRSGQCPMIGRKEGNVLFNDAFNTFYLRLYGVRHMVKDHSDSEKGNLLPQHRLLFPINRKGSFICTIPQTGQHIPQPLLHHEGLIRRSIAPWANALTTELPHDWSNNGHGMCYPVWGIVHIKEPMLLIRKSIPCDSSYLSGPLPYVQHHITVNKMCWVHR